MSLAPLVRWEYGYTPSQAAREACSPNLFHAAPGLVAGRIH